MRGSHHSQVRQVIETALAFERFEGAIKDRQVFWFQSGRNRRSIGISNVLNGVERVDVRDDAFDFFGIIAEFFQRGFDRLVDNFQHSAACEQLVFHQRYVWFDSSRVTIHQETDRAGRRKHGHLRVPITAAFSKFRRAVPNFRGFFFQVREFLRI